MALDFENSFEYDLFKELTSINMLSSYEKIDTSKNVTEDFYAVLKKYKDKDYRDFFKYFYKRDFRDKSSIASYKDYCFLHPMMEMLGQFQYFGFLSKDFTPREDLLIDLNKEIPRNKLSQLNINEGVILPDGMFMVVPQGSRIAHKLTGLWLYLNGYDAKNAVRFFLDGMSPNPHFSSMSEYIKRDKEEIEITNEQARAIFNIYKSMSYDEYHLDVALRSSKDLCLHAKGNERVRKYNALTFEDVLGSQYFDANEVLREIRKELFMMHKQPGDQD